MQPRHAPYRPRSFSRTTHLPVPSAQVNGGPIWHIESLQTSSATGSPNSIGNFNMLNNDLDQARAVYFPTSPTAGSFQEPSAMYASFDRNSYTGSQDTSSPSIAPVLSGVGAHHDHCHDSFGQPVSSPGFTIEIERANLDLHPSADPWQMISKDDAESLPPRNAQKTPSNESTTFSVVNFDCQDCKSREESLGNIRNQVQDLAQQLRDYEETVRQQHAIIQSQQMCIQELEKSNLKIVANYTKKRGHSPIKEDLRSPSGQPTQDSRTIISVPKRGKFAPQQRKQTAETRKKGACVRCWKHKQRCVTGDDLEGRCKNCQELSLTIIQLPCIRTRIVELSIFRCGTGDNDTWTRRDEVEKPMDLTTYVSEERRVLDLSHGFGPSLRVKVRRYQPVRDDAMEYKWRDALGHHRTWSMPPFALCDIDELTINVDSYIRDNQNAYIQRFVKSEDVPTWNAFVIAQKLAVAEQSLLLQEVLQLWMAARLIEKPWQICGKDTLGLQTEDRWYWIPVTPIMDTQLDQVVIKMFLLPLKRKVLHRLQTQIEKNCRKNWLEIFVAVVILLNTLEEAIRHDHEFATFFGHEYSPGRKRFEDYKLIESYFHAALTLLTHVKVAFDGRLPYLDEHTDISKLMNACQDGDEKDYMIATDKYVSNKQKKTNFDKMRERHDYEAQQFWVHQLFLKDWDGRMIAIEENQ